MNRLRRLVAERQLDALDFRFFAAGNFRERGAEGLQAKIIFAAGALGAVKKRGKFDELVPRVEKVEIKDLLPCHSFVGRKIEGNRYAANGIFII